MRERNDRATGTKPRDGARGAAGEGGDEDRLRLQRLREVARRVRHRLADRRVVRGLGELVPVVEARLDRPRDPIHVRDGLDRVLADGRLAGEHHGGRPVEDRVRDVARLRARRLRRMNHRLASRAVSPESDRDTSVRRKAPIPSAYIRQNSL